MYLFDRFSTITATPVSTNVIRIKGLNVYNLFKDISDVWQTSIIVKYMLIRQNEYAFTVRNFFIPDLLYILDTLIEHRKVPRLNKGVYRTLREEILKNTWLSSTVGESTPVLDYSRLDGLHWQPLDYQREFLDYYNDVYYRYRLKGILLAAAPGLGKTFTTLCLAHLVKSDIVMVIAPKNSIYRVWEATIKAIYKMPERCWVADADRPYQGERFLVFHYERLEEALTYASKFRAQNTTIILDESHNLNELKSKRTQLFLELCKQTQSKHILFSSGTPIKAIGAESIPLFKAIDPYFDDISMEAFKKIYGSAGKVGLDIIRTRLGLVSYKIEKERTNLNKPVLETFTLTIPNGEEYTLESIAEKMRVFIADRAQYYKGRQKDDHKQYLDILDTFAAKHVKSREQREALALYNDYVKLVQSYHGKFLYEIKDQVAYCNRYELSTVMPTLSKEDRVLFKELKTIYKYVELKIQGEALGRCLGALRIRCHVDMVEHIDFVSMINSSRKKTVIFTSFVEVLEKAKSHLTTIGYNPLVVYGSTNSQLSSIIETFEKDRSRNPLIATFASLSTAVPLVMANVVILLNQPYRAYIQEQAISRVHRLGADTEVYVYNIVLDTTNKPNISSRSLDILKWSQDMVSEIMGIDSIYTVETSGDDINISTETYDIDASVNVSGVLNQLGHQPNWARW